VVLGLSQVSVEEDVVERDNGNASAGVEGAPTYKMISAMERLHTIGRRYPSPETAPATALPSPKALMTPHPLPLWGMKPTLRCHG
jgi:hypothetical protein